MRPLASGALLSEIPAFRTEKLGSLFVTHASEITDGLFDAAPRVYWITNDSDTFAVRGGHMHPEGGKKEYIVMLRGIAVAELHSESGCDQITLFESKEALVIPCGVWHRFTLEPGAILLSVASEPFRVDEAVTEAPCPCAL